MEEATQNRTVQQNRALHLYFRLLSDMFRERGIDARMFFKPEIEIPISPYMVKEMIWRPVMKAYTGKQSTTELDKTKDINEIVDILNRHLSEKFGNLGYENIPFPSYEQLFNQAEHEEQFEKSTK